MTEPNKPTEEDLGIAARCWCDPRTSNREMDSNLATVFAEVLAEERAKLEAKVQAYRDVAFNHAVKRDDPKGWDDAYGLVDAEAEKILLAKDRR